MIKNRLVVFIQLVLLVAEAGAQSIWDGAHLAQVKSCLEQPAYATAYHQLIADADTLMRTLPVSVMMKEKTAVSGSKHDYLSLSRYYWPDPSEPDGLPYIVRDGVSNPELEKYDRPRLAEMARRVTTLSLAWYFSNNECYAQKAVEQLRVWFLNCDTRMNPNLNYAQTIPGKFGGKGRCYGVIDGYSFVEMLDAVQLLEQSKAFTAKDAKGLKHWFSQFLQWILTSEQGIEESQQLNNHSTAHDAQVMAYAKYVGNQQVLNQYLSAFYQKRMQAQIEPDGRQPRELRRTLAFGYSQYNLSHIIDVFQIARAVGYKFQPEAHQLLENATNYLAQYLGKKVEAWPYQQIGEWDYKQQLLAHDLYRLWLLIPERTDYQQLACRHIVKRFSDRFFLLYYKPCQIDQAFAAADTQLRYLLQNTEQARKIAKDKSKIMPRCLEKDGSLRLVGMYDWCSGFFPGSLWQMYEYSHDAFWREQAVSNTWKIEEVKYHKGTHDLGFMMYNSFGQAYRLTGEQSYRDVVVQSAKTLATRFNEQVGCIRSWSWGTPDRWQFAVIIDNMINLELLFEASRLTNDKRYYQMAVSHANTTMAHHFREDGSSYHVVDYNPENGKVIKRITHQGLFDESVWSRGQAWGLYGFTMCYRYTHDEAYLRQAQKIAKFFFSQQNMPADLIPYWDMRDPNIPDAPRDASAAAVFASGLFELATYSDTVLAKEYRRIANHIISSLVSGYQPAPRTMRGFLLDHSTGNYPAQDEIDVPINYADYYYLEALRRSITLADDRIEDLAAPQKRILVLAERGGVHEPFTARALQWLQDNKDRFSLDLTICTSAKELKAGELDTYNLVLQLNHPPYEWSEVAQKEFHEYIERGHGGYIGFHHATLLGEFDGYPMWSWFSDFMGRIRYKNYIAEESDGKVVVEDIRHPVMQGVPDSFVIEDDEWYTYDQSPRRNVQVLAHVDEASYTIDTNVKMGDHPVVWSNPYVAARNVYFQFGHSATLWDNPVFVRLVENAIRWAGEELHEAYPASYASAPRFKALVYWNPLAEEAHVQFDRQAMAFFQKLTYGNGWIMEQTTSLADYPYDRLKGYDVIISLNAMPHVEVERRAFELYMENGGGWMGFHASAYNDKNTHWPWFNRFLGCGVFYCNNWPPQPVLVERNILQHPVTKSIPHEFVAPSSEFYQWNPSPRNNSDVDVLLSISQKMYPFGLKDVVKFGDFPLVWTNKKYRMIYLNMGHGNEGFMDTTQQLLFINALRWIVSCNPNGNPLN